MSIENTLPETENEFTGRATYCPEDNKLRLYVGRVPRDEYLKLRAEGWTALHKQREAGGGDFVATWTPDRRDTALEYAGIIEDEDMGPADRAADRAERFGGYRDKRAGEATDRADRFDVGPSVHGFQSQARAERSARRHDKIAGRACDAWSKAEYWQSRTAGVILHALHVSSPSVRMGRIKELEADLRRMEQNPDSYPNWLPHTRLRLAYENQMLEAQGGRAGVVEMVPGGTFRGAIIEKINKSNVTGRVVSVLVIGPAVQRWTYKASNVSGTGLALYQHDVERAAPESYQPPTAESLAKLAEFEQAKKDAAKKRKAEVGTCPLVNPTEADAEKLQAIWNAAAASRFKDRNLAPSTVLRCAFSQYDGRGHVATICETGCEHRSRYGRDLTRVSVFKVRAASSEEYYAAPRVVVLTDKAQKPLPWDLLEKAKKAQPTAETIRARLPQVRALLSDRSRWQWNKDENALLSDAEYVGWIDRTCSFPEWKDAGLAELRAMDQAPAFALES